MINVTENIYNASFITTFWNNKVMDVVIPLNASNSFMMSCTGLVRNFVKILKINKFQFNLHPHDGLCLVHIFHCFRDEWCLEDTYALLNEVQNYRSAVDLLRYKKIRKQ